MDHSVDKRGKFEEEIFTYRVTKDKKVFISWYGKQVTTLSGSKAENFIESISDVDDKEAQFMMAKVTGNFKRGNEKINKRRG